jgi:hypothetical protein
MEGVPADLMCFLNGPLQIVKNQIISLAPDVPRKTALKKTNATEPFKSLAQRLIKETLHRRKMILWTKILFFWQRTAKWCWPCIATFVELMCNCGTYAPPTKGSNEGNLVNLHRDFTASFINHHCLMDDGQSNATSFCALVLCQMIFHIGRWREEFHSARLCGIGFLRATCLVIYFLLSLVE